ncbi:FAD-dependent oxidoreductase [Celerinatantimonas yamalensis]|uniref:FAD-dependent oxidoreductase n=1 Tax=Celerinatantimonas yamalensis TaxID=559956 RepID=A0ABW9G3L6_9GAMM
MKRVVIIGGVAGGASAAARLRRMDESVEIVLLERGPYISFANCGLPYHISGEISAREDLLVQTPERFSKRFNVDVRIHHEAIEIDPKEHRVVVKADGQVYSLNYDKLLLSPGASAIKPNLPGMDDARVLLLRSLPDMDQIIAQLQHVTKDRPIAVLGAGFIGLEITEALHQLGYCVMLIEAGAQVMASIDPEMASPLHRTLRQHGIDLRLNSALKAVRPQTEELVLELSSGESVDVSMLICAVGVRAENQLAQQAGLVLGQGHSIQVNQHLQTSDPDIYAVGDAIEVIDWVTGQPASIPLAGPANRQGRIAADNMAGRECEYRGTQGSSICRVFDLAVASTGASEKRLKAQQIAYRKLYTHSSQHAGYYPGAQPIHLKLLFSPDNGRLLGGQAVGKDGVDKRIDVLALALQAQMSVYDLEELELCYAPPYGSAKDPLNQAGFVAVNWLEGNDELIYPEQVADYQGQILDIRNEAELQNGMLPNALHIPLDELRTRMNELNPTLPIMVYCQVGLRGHVAARMLCQSGWKVVNLTGGYRTYCDWQQSQQGEL